jgi:hypothetical protein
MMTRAVLVLVAWTLILLGSAPDADAYQVVSVTPGSGPPGTTVQVIIADFLPGVPIEVHEGSRTGPLLGGPTVANSSGNAFVEITIPAGAPVGTYSIYVCGSCSSEFFDEASTTFQVTAPPTTTTTTTTTSTTTTTTTLPPAGEPCEIPRDAIVIDWDGFDPDDLGLTGELMGPLEFALVTDGYDLLLHQWAEYVFSAYPPTDDDPSLLLLPRVDAVGRVADNPARDLWTSSPPNVMRLFDDTHWSVLPYVNPMPSHIGFNVGFGHFGEGFETPDEVVVELHVRAMPMQMPDGSVLDQGAWASTSVTLGPGPQPVTTCLEARNTIGSVDPHTVYMIDILPRTAGGDPIHIPLDIDDLFFARLVPPTPPFLLDFDPADLPGFTTTTSTLPSAVTTGGAEVGYSSSSMNSTRL